MILKTLSELFFGIFGILYVLFERNYFRFENILIFIICVLLYMMNTLTFSKINNFILHYFFTGYFNDLIAPLLLFSYINLLLSFIDKNVYSLKYLIIIIISCSFFWEYLVLFFKPTGISDPVDVLFYIMGTLIYWIIYKIWIQTSNINIKLY